MLTSFVAGALAGWAIAIPVGAIGVLIVELGIRRGFRVAAAAGAGAASADGIYATLAAVGGTALAAFLEPVERPLRIVAILALLAIGIRGLLRVRAAAGSVPGCGIPGGGAPRGGAAGSALPWSGALESGPGSVPPPTGVVPTYLRFLGLTLLNPQTVIYFAALILALPAVGRGPGERGAFVAGAFLASLSWQTLLAGISAVAHHRLAPRFQVAVSLLGNLVICGFAVLLALDL